MSAPNTRIEVDSATAKALSDQASSLGLSVTEFLHTHFCGNDAPYTIDDVDAWLDGLAEGMDGVPTLPDDFSTQDLYTDHD